MEVNRSDVKSKLEKSRSCQRNGRSLPAKVVKELESAVAFQRTDVFDKSFLLG
jgi:hypothetical protein